jgi:alanine racemase
MKILEINKADLENNINIIKKIISDSEKKTKIIAVVKANRNGIRYSKVI